MDYEKISEYISGWVGREDPTHEWVRKKSIELNPEGVFPIDTTRGRFLELVARLRHPRKVLEIGSGAGYSALWFMKGMGETGKLEAVEGNPRVAQVLRQVIEKAGLKRRILVREGPALEVLAELNQKYDILFIDAAKAEYPDYLTHAMRLTKKGSVILADNMFWSGATVSGNLRAEGARPIAQYTKKIFNDPRLSSLIIPLGDGIAISHRIK